MDIVKNIVDVCTNYISDLGILFGFFIVFIECFLPVLPLWLLPTRMAWKTWTGGSLWQKKSLTEPCSIICWEKMILIRRPLMRSSLLIL